MSATYLRRLTWIILLTVSIQHVEMTNEYNLTLLWHRTQKGLHGPCLLQILVIFPPYSQMAKGTLTTIDRCHKRVTR